MITVNLEGRYPHKHTVCTANTDWPRWCDVDSMHCMNEGRPSLWLYGPRGTGAPRSECIVEIGGQCEPLEGPQTVLPSFTDSSVTY